MSPAERALLFMLAGTVRALLLEEDDYGELADVINDLVMQVAAELPEDEPGPPPHAVIRLSSMIERLKAQIAADKAKAR